MPSPWLARSKKRRSQSKCYASSQPPWPHGSSYLSSGRFGDCEIQARKRHININFLVRLLLGHPGNVPGTNRVCPRDKVGLSQGQTQVFSLLYMVEAQFVPGTNPVPGTFRERRAAERVYVLKVFVPFSFPRNPALSKFGNPDFS